MAPHIGIVGLGSIGRQYVEALRNIECDITVFRHKKGYEYDDLLNMEPVITQWHVDAFETQHKRNPFDLVIICNPTTFHQEWARRCVDAGIPVLVEKPFYDPWDQMLDISIFEKGNIYIGYQLRVHPALDVVKMQLKEAENVYKVEIVNHEHLPDVHPWEADWKQGYAARRDLGGGVLNCYSHEIDYYHALGFGPLYEVETQCPPSVLGTDVEEQVLITGKDVMDVQLSMNLSFVYGRGNQERTCTIYTDRGRIRWDVNAGNVFLDYHDSITEIVRYDYGYTKAFLLLDEVIRILDGKAGGTLAGMSSAMFVGEFTNMVIDSIEEL
jgi:predicted dehydrogenase